MNQLPMVVFAVTSLLGGLGVTAKSLDESSVMEDLSSVSSFSLSDYPKMAGLEHSAAVHGDFQAVTVSDGAEAFSKLYIYLYHPSGVKGGYWDGKKYSVPSGYNFKISDSHDWSSYYRVSGKLLSVSSDNLFWKFRIDYQFPFDSSSASRGYDLASIDVMNPEGTESNAYAIGDRFVLTGSGSSKSVDHTFIDVISLDVGVFSYLYSSKNNHSRDWYRDPGWDTASFVSCYSRILCCGFHFPSSYGSLVGLRLSWTEALYNVDRSKDYESQPYKVGDSLSYLMDYTDTSRICLPQDRSWWLEALDVLQIPVIQFIPDSASFKVFEKIDPQKAIDGEPSYLLQDDGVKYFKAEFAKAPEDDYYIIRFDYRDVTVVQNSGVPAWLSVLGHLVFLPVLASGIEALGAQFNGSRVSSWEVDDISVITLTFDKDGKSYVLPVSADSKMISAVFPGKSGFDWEKFFRVCLLCGGIFAGVYVTYRIVRGAKGKARYGRR